MIFVTTNRITFTGRKPRNIFQMQTCTVCAYTDVVHTKIRECVRNLLESSSIIIPTMPSHNGRSANEAEIETPSRY